MSIDTLPLAPVVQVLPGTTTPTSIDGVQVRLSDNWEGLRGPVKSKPAAIALAKRMAHQDVRRDGEPGTVGDAFVVRPEEGFWAVRMILDASGSPLCVRHEASA